MKNKNIMLIAAFCCIAGANSVKAQSLKIPFRSSMLKDTVTYIKSIENEITISDRNSLKREDYLKFDVRDLVARLSQLKENTAASLDISPVIFFEGTVLPVLQTDKDIRRFRIQNQDGLSDLLISLFYNKQNEIEAFSAAIIHIPDLPYTWMIRPTPLNASYSWNIYALKDIITE